jgi:hypothetical protein
MVSVHEYGIIESPVGTSGGCWVVNLEQKIKKKTDVQVSIFSELQHLKPVFLNVSTFV